jgi:hypothetical protein
METKRPKQTNCQNEPSYPDHETVVFSIRFPDYYLGETDGELEVKRWDELPSTNQ